MPYGLGYPLQQDNEQAFQQWYASRARRLGLDPNPDNPQHFYDYRAAFKAGAEPNASGHWPSEFKRPGHPRLVLNGIDTRTGSPPYDPNETFGPASSADSGKAPFDPLEALARLHGPVPEPVPQVQPQGFMERLAQLTGGEAPFSVSGDVHARGGGAVIPLALLSAILGYKVRQASGRLKERQTQTAAPVEARNKQAEEAFKARLESLKTMAGRPPEGPTITAPLYGQPGKTIRVSPSSEVGQNVIRYGTTTAPVKEPLVAIQTPSGPIYVRQSEALGKPPPAPAGAQAGKLPSAQERKELAADATALGQSQAIGGLYRPEFVGPLSGKRAAIASALGQPAALAGIRLYPGESDFKAALAIYRNAVINALSGAAVSESEAKRMKQQIPAEDNPSEVFEARLRQTEGNLRRVAAKRRQLFTETGLDLSGLSPLPRPPLESFERP